MFRKKHKLIAEFELNAGKNSLAEIWNNAKDNPPGEFENVIVFSEKNGITAGKRVGTGFIVAGDPEVDYSVTHWLPLSELKNRNAK